MTRPRLLDLFCGAGGAAVGYHRAGFDVVGVDIEPQPHYPFPFVQADALTYPLDGFDAIHASPPCQHYSVAVHPDDRHLYPDLLPPTRERLAQRPEPWVIENVPGAPMRPDLILCGCMFDLPLLRRQRWFECGGWTPDPWRQPCHHPRPTLSVTGHGVGAGNGQRGRIAAHLGRNPGIADARAAMGIDWMNREELAEAIPPAYAERVGRQLLDHLNAVRA